jgi:hypothetical protein
VFAGCSEQGHQKGRKPPLATWRISCAQRQTVFLRALVEIKRAQYEHPAAKISEHDRKSAAVFRASDDSRYVIRAELFEDGGLGREATGVAKCERIFL